MFAIIEGYYREDPPARLVLDDNNKVAVFKSHNDAHAHCAQKGIGNYTIVQLTYTPDGSRIDVH